MTFTFYINTIIIISIKEESYEMKRLEGDLLVGLKNVFVARYVVCKWDRTAVTSDTLCAPCPVTLFTTRVKKDADFWDYSVVLRTYWNNGNKFHTIILKS